ncbi:hypothetical protein, partial [Escherichia coli]|uniref:hypothetical protein n=1 Tax=Escherichia coli TaxID=562 RepID=UPI00202BAAE7
SLKTSIKTITYLSDIGCLEIQGASLLLSGSEYRRSELLSPVVRFTDVSAALCYEFDHDETTIF